MMATFSLIISVAVYIFLFSMETVSCDEVTKCIDGPFHKSYSSPEDSGYVECLPWKENTCCTANFTRVLKTSQAKKLYNFDWHHCGHTKNLSKACERYIKEEECFYSCEPSLIKFLSVEGNVESVPVCAEYCNSWFDACKDDLTCAKDWATGFNYTGGGYYCKTDSTCQTFEQVYKNGEGLCNAMWGKWFKYETNSKNCMKMWFTGSNPNTDVVRKNVDSGGTLLTSSWALMCVTMLSLIVPRMK